ncbi:MAG: hypothetical protein RR914_00075, partial [Oscillospiraceae bacterium]
EILVELMNAGIRGGSLLDCEGVLQALGHNSIEPPPMFGSLRQYLNPERGDTNKMLISALKDEDIAKAKQIINKVTGGFDKPNTGILITLPIGTVEGIA